MMDTFKVYEITVQPHENFTFYQHEGKLFNSNSLERPAPVQPSYIYSASTKKFNPHMPPYNIWVDKITVPVVGVIPEDLRQYIEDQSIEVAKIISKKNLSHNIVIATKILETNLLGVGLFHRDAITDQRNYWVEEIVNRFFRLKAFW
jgi:hypothetical protein